MHVNHNKQPEQINEPTSFNSTETFGLKEKAGRFVGFKKITPYQPPVDRYIVKPSRSNIEDTKLPERTISKTNQKSIIPTVSEQLSRSGSVKSTDSGFYDDWSNDDIFEVHPTISPLSLIDELKNNYLHFRATADNLKQLKENLFSIGLARKKSETDEAFMARINTAVTQSFPTKKVMNSNQFETLKQHLDTPEHLAETPDLLAETLGKKPFTDKQDALKWFSACRHYMVNGEGKQELAKYHFKNNHLIAKYLPTVDADGISEIDLNSLHEMQKFLKDPTPTETSIHEKAAKDHGFKLVEGTTEILFSATNPLHRSLVLTDKLEKFYLALRDGILSTYSVEPTPQLEKKAEKAQNFARAAKDVTDSISHTLMIQGMPEQFGRKGTFPYSYQHTVLRDENGLIRWGSDDKQFRAGRWDNRELPPVNLPT